MDFPARTLDFISSVWLEAVPGALRDVALVTLSSTLLPIESLVPFTVFGAILRLYAADF